VLADRVHSGGDPEEALDELQHELFVSLVVPQQAQGQFECRPACCAIPEILVGKGLNMAWRALI
jgi:hypothetical protein